MTRKKAKRKPEKPKAPSQWSASVILGLVVGSLGLVGLIGLIALRPQISVTPQPPLENHQPFSVPFLISNNGLLALHVSKVHCYEDEIQVNGLTMNANAENLKEWDNAELERADGETIICSLVSGAIPSKADITIVVDFDASLMLWAAPRRYFRFVGTATENWQWLKQPPSEDLKTRIDRTLEKTLAKPQ